MQFLYWENLTQRGPELISHGPLGNIEDLNGWSASKYVNRNKIFSILKRESSFIMICKTSLSGEIPFKLHRQI